MLALAYFTGAFLVTLWVTSTVLRRRLAREKRLLYLAAFAGTVAANALFFLLNVLIGRIYATGWRVFTHEAWHGLNSPSSLLVDASLFIVLGTAICILPMLALAYYFERHSKRKTPPSEKSPATVPSQLSTSNSP